MSRSSGLYEIASLGLMVLAGCALTPNRALTSIDISPAATQDSGSAAGVQFVATGTLSNPPASLSPLPVNWSFTGFTALPVPAGVTIDNTGLAHCTGFHGSVMVFAIHPVDPMAPPPMEISPGFGMGFVAGSARLTCS